MKHLLAVSACACLVAGGVLAQERERERTREQTTVTTTTTFTGNAVLAYKVNLGGAAFGKVYDFVITPEGCIEYIVLVDNTNYVFVPWHVVHFDTGARALTIQITRDRLKDVTFTKDTWPKDFRDATFRQKVDTVFGQAKNRSAVERSTSEKRDTERRPGEGDQGKPGDAKKPDKPGSQPPKDKDNPPKDKDKENPPKDKDKPDKPKKDEPPKKDG